MTWIKDNVRTLLILNVIHHLKIWNYFSVEGSSLCLVNRPSLLREGTFAAQQLRPEQYRSSCGERSANVYSSTFTLESLWRSPGYNANAFLNSQIYRIDANKMITAKRVRPSEAHCCIPQSEDEVGLFGRADPTGGGTGFDYQQWNPRIRFINPVGFLSTMITGDYEVYLLRLRRLRQIRVETGGVEVWLRQP
jgi:hypothetical protein